MMGKLRGRLTYANVMATLAVFMVLGGSAYAMEALPKHSVGTKQLKNGAVTAAKVKKGSLLAADFKTGQLPAGPQGPKGDQGPPGASPLANVVVRYGPEVEIPTSAGSFSYAPCDSGETIVGGGYSLNKGTSSPDFSITANRPSNKVIEASLTTYPAPAEGTKASGWLVGLENVTGVSFGFRAYVMCGS